MEVAQLAGETRVARRMGLQGHVDVKDFCRRIVDTSGQRYSAGWQPGLFRQDGHMRKLQRICLRWVGEKKLPAGWTRQRSGAGGELEEEEGRRREEEEQKGF